MGFTREHEVVLVRGSGCEVYDRDGNAYLDATAALWYCNVGHGRERIADAIREQAARLAACSCFDVYTSDRTLELAERVGEIAPVDGATVFFTSGGSDSIDTAAKLARRYWAEVGQPEKTFVVARSGAYHGLHAYGTSLAGIPANREGFGELVRDVVLVPAMDADALACELDRLAGRVAAFVAEPVLGAGGVHPPPPDYLAEVARICGERNVLFIADEVITGFGRLGQAFACERYGVRPDLLVVAKGITSGYLPLGAVICASPIAEPFWRRDGEVWFRHGYTYSGHATACAAALANLDILEEEGLVARVAELEPRLASIMGGLAELDEVSEVRTVGLLAGVQMAPGTDPGLAARAASECRQRGVLTRSLAGNALQVSPPFTITHEQLERIAFTFAEGIRAASPAAAAVPGAPARAGRADKLTVAAKAEPRGGPYG